MAALSFLDIVNICDNVHIGRPSPTPSPFDSEVLVPLCLTPSGPVLGLLRPVVLDQLRLENERSHGLGLPAIWDINTIGSEHRPSVNFQNWLDTPAKRTAAMKGLCERWRDSSLFEDVCGPKKWRAEMYPIYKDPFGTHDYPAEGDEQDLNYAFEVERSACALFGFITYGVHLSIYQEMESSIAIWVPTRAITKQT